MGSGRGRCRSRWFLAVPVAVILAAAVSCSSGATGTDEDEAQPSETVTESVESDTPAVIEALGCGSVDVFSDKVDCVRNGQTAVLTFTGTDGPTVEVVVRSTASLDVYNEVADTFFEMPEGVLYLPSEFFDESIELADPDDPYGAQVIDTDLYVSHK